MVDGRPIFYSVSADSICHSIVPIVTLQEYFAMTVSGYQYVAALKVVNRSTVFNLVIILMLQLLNIQECC